MSALWRQFGVTITLHLRNKMALIYSYLFPTIFLVAFWVLYRYEQVPLARHMGELLTVTALGGACFGLPTTMVSERERGVWRRYKLAPVPTSTLVGGTVLARYCLLIAAGVLQLLLAMGIGMPLPKHPFELVAAFTCVAVAFIGLGLVIAMLADNVPAVQALGQCIFLPMLIIGGVAVPLASLPDWAQRLSTFFPGRYAVEAIQSTVTGNGLMTARFSVLALLLMGAAGFVAGAKMFRWDAQQRFATSASKGWVVVALGAWVVVGIIAGSAGTPPATTVRAATTTAPTTSSAAAPSSSQPSTAQPTSPAGSTTATSPAATLPSSPRLSRAEQDAIAHQKKPAPAANAPAAAAAPLPEVTPVPAETAPTPSVANGRAPASWREVTLADIDRDLIFTRLPPDAGVVTPIARPDDLPDDSVNAQLEQMRVALTTWKPGKVEDPVQRVRNFLFVAAVADIFQMEELERFIPHLIFERLEEDVPKEDLVKILYWIALHPFDGDDKAVDELKPLGLGNGPGDIEATRERVGIYAVKLLGRLTGHIPRT
jgi:hypothetical protein